MKRWFRRVGVGVILILIGIAGFIFWSDSETTMASRYVSNEGLKTIRAGWPGTPVDEKGRFVNDEFPLVIKMSNVIKWQVSRNPQRDEKKQDPYRMEVKDPGEFLAGDNDGILWLGHASFFIRLAGKGILIDPVFGDPSILKRLVPVESPIEKLEKVDYVLLSHDHRDHADEATNRAIAAKFPQAKFMGGLGMDDILKEWSGREALTAGWFQQFGLPDENVKIFFLPVRHWCRRGVFDTNKRLWGGFVIEGGSNTIYFGGDSGFGRHYRETAELFPKIDYFLIGIGAYSPRWFMEPNHNSPEDALKAFRDSGAKTLVPMHYGSFDLSDEPAGEPLRLLYEKACEMGLRDRIRRLNIGENIQIEDK